MAQYVFGQGLWRPFQGFWGFGEKGHLFSGIWGESITFWGLGSREQGAEEKQFRELGRKVIFLSGSREQRHPPPWGGANFAYVILSSNGRTRIERVTINTC